MSVYTVLKRVKQISLHGWKSISTDVRYYTQHFLRFRAYFFQGFGKCHKFHLRRLKATLTCTFAIFVFTIPKNQFKNTCSYKNNSGY